MTLKTRIDKLEERTSPINGEDEMVEVRVIGGPDDGKTILRSKHEIARMKENSMPPGIPGACIIVEDAPSGLQNAVKESETYND